MAKSDLIERAALVAELTARKNAAADPVLQFLFDQVIVAVERQPAVNARPKLPVIRSCDSCAHSATPSMYEPCHSCVGTPGAPFPNWEAADG